MTATRTSLGRRRGGRTLVSMALALFVLHAGARVAHSQCPPVAGPGIWEANPAFDMPVPLSGINAVKGRDGWIYIAGGTNDSGGSNTPEAGFYRFRPSLGIWETLPDLPFGPNAGPALAADHLGRIYIIGGGRGETILDEVARFDPESGVWATLASLPDVRLLGKAVADRSGRSVYLAGGLANPVFDSGSTNSVLRYDVDTDTWHEATPLLHARVFHGLVLGGDDNIYAIGGQEFGQGTLSPPGRTVERFDPETSVWTEVASLDQHPHTIGAAAADSCGYLWAISGWNPGYSAAVERYDIAQDVWESMPPINLARNNAGVAFGDDGRLWLLGGDSGTVETASVESAYVCRPVPSLAAVQAGPAVLGVVADACDEIAGATCVVRIDPAVARVDRIFPGADLPAGAEIIENRVALGTDGNPIPGAVLLGWIAHESGGGLATISPGVHELFRLEVFKTAGSPESQCTVATFPIAFRSSLASPVLTSSLSHASGATVGARTIAGEFCLQPLFMRGDSNRDGKLDLSDAVFTLLWLAIGAVQLDCVDAADVNDDGAVDIGDVVYWTNHLFLAGPPPASPYGIDLACRGCVCGVDETEDALDCLTSSPLCVME